MNDRLSIVDPEAGPWVSWFVNGKAVHVPVDSRQGQIWAAELSAYEDTHSRLCVACGNVFMSSRKHTQTCSPACRKRASRRSQRL